MSEELRAKWNIRHAEAEDIGEAPTVLRDHLHLLPPTGNALDLACGRGAGALLLASRGLRVQAWDLSEVAVGRLAEEAQRRGLTNIHTQVRDVICEPPEPRSFDLILVSFFLERALATHLIAALRPGGLLFYQTFTRAAVSSRGPSNPQYRLDDNELLRMFSGLHLRFYREEGLLGDLEAGCRDVAMLVGEKPGRERERV